MKKQTDSSIKKVLASLKRLPVSSYESFDLDSLAAYAIHTLEQKKVPLYFDFIAVALFRMFPKKFSMASFIQYPDTNRIDKAVRRLTDQKNKRWATGNIENGFGLTELGQETAKQVAAFLANPRLKGLSKPAVVTKSRGRSYSDDVQEIKLSDAFRKWQTEQEVNSYEFFAFLKATPYTPKPLIAEHLKRLEASAATIKDQEVMGFLSWLSKKFQSLLN